MLKFYLYRSQSTFGQFSVEDVGILRCALARNPNFGITGFLYRNDTHYYQYFEGNSGVADQLLINLQRDTKHYDLQVILSGYTNRPRFNGWSMGYARSSLVEAEHLISIDDCPKTVIRKLELEAANQALKFNKSITSDMGKKSMPVDIL